MSTTKKLKRVFEVDSSSEDEIHLKKKKQLPRRKCLVCDAEKGSNQFPSHKRVSSHEHDHNVCRPCYRSHLKSEIDSKDWNEVACPECPITLTYKEVKNMTTTRNFAKYAIEKLRASMILLILADTDMSKHASERLLQQTRTSDTVFLLPASLVNCTRVVRTSPYSVVRNVVTSTALSVMPIGTKTKRAKSSRLYASDFTPRTSNPNKQSKRSRSLAQSARCPLRKIKVAIT